MAWTPENYSNGLGHLNDVDTLGTCDFVLV